MFPCSTEVGTVLTPVSEIIAFLVCIENFPEWNESYSSLYVERGVKK